MVFNDGTMEVMIDGKKCIRLVDHVDVAKGYELARVVPWHGSNEEVIWTVGSDIPMIVKVRE